MRPHKLIMKAFGPFAKETIVDFDRMGDSIYLICGDTGSGKTTIFDGIMYALYGTASGGARSGLGTEAFHSDYAKDGAHREEMRVEFIFSNAGRTFDVMRRVYWGQKGNSKNSSKESVLSEGGNTIVYDKGREDKGDVTMKIREILGLDADQFRRIIMLAQGEFQKFLTAKSADRGEILGKLYDNRRDKDLQQRLKAASALLGEQERNALNEAQAQVNMFRFPEWAGEEEKEGFTADHPALLLRAGEIADRMSDELEEMSSQIKGAQEAWNRLTEIKTKAEEGNKLLNSLDEKREYRAQLSGREMEVKRLRELAARAQEAGNVLPADKNMRSARENLERVTERIRSLEKEKDELTQAAKALKAESEDLEKKNTPEISTLRERQSLLGNAMSFYEKLAESRARLRDCEQNQKTGERALQKAEEDLDKKKKKQEALDKTLRSLESAGENAVTNRKHALDEKEMRKADLSAIHESIGNVCNLIKEETSLKQKFACAMDHAHSAGCRHMELEEAFLSGQAGVLAQGMREKLQKEKEVICPVCGSVHTEKDVHLFAKLTENIPRKEDVDKAYKEMQDAHDKANQADNDLTVKTTQRREQMSALLKRSADLIGVSEWDELTAGSALQKADDQCEKEYAAAGEEYRKAVKEKADKEKALAEKLLTDREAAGAEDALREALQKKTDADTKAAAARAAVDSCSEHLKGYPAEKEEAQRLIRSLGEQAEKLFEEVEKKKKEYTDKVSRLDQVCGNLAGAKEEREKRKSELGSARKHFADMLARYSFADDESWHTALSPEGMLLDMETLEAWLKEKNSVIREYDDTCRSVDSAIRQLEESTKGTERRDIPEIEQKMKEAEERFNQLRSGGSTLSANLEINRKVIGELEKIGKKRERYRRLSGKLKPLADTANGKLAFSRYVLNGFFHRIVEQANTHLEMMTDNEYSLVPKETGDGRENIGLDLKVLNTITGLERDTATLSGGQMFEASLSLALGLSDVVQMDNTGTVRIDSMFIDEGFGSLDGIRLDKSIEVLRHLSAGKRQIGIISHVAKLDECLPNKIHVIALDRGSTVRIETDI